MTKEQLKADVELKDLKEKELDKIVSLINVEKAKTEAKTLELQTKELQLKAKEDELKEKAQALVKAEEKLKEGKIALIEEVNEVYKEKLKYAKSYIRNRAGFKTQVFWASNLWEDTKNEIMADFNDL